MAAIKLLLLKAGNRYLRHSADGFSECSLDKASVFPLSENSKVLELLAQAQKSAYPEATIRVLELHERPYQQKKPTK